MNWLVCAVVILAVVLGAVGLVAVLVPAAWMRRGWACFTDASRRRVRVTRRTWMTDDELATRLRGQCENPIVTGLLNMISREEEDYRQAGDRTGVSAEDRAFLQGAAMACRRLEELVEEMVRRRVESWEDGA